jgi:hypothetical protein
VDRDTVFVTAPRPAQGHYIALAIKPASSPDDTGDFHFWRLDSNGAWSYKVCLCVCKRGRVWAGTLKRPREKAERRCACVCVWGGGDGVRG